MNRDEFLYKIWAILKETYEQIKPNAYSAVSKITDYMYELSYDNLISEAEAEEYLSTKYKGSIGNCTSVFNSTGLLGRNLDWYYSNLAEFIIHTPSTATTHASVCIGGNIPGLTDEAVSSGKSSDSYKYLPYTVVDGVNDDGLGISVNVVPTDSIYGRTTGTNLGKPGMCMLRIVRYVLDHHDDIDEAIEDLSNNWNIYSPSGSLNQEFHFLICKGSTSKVIEFINNTLVVPEDVRQDVITNFRVYNTELSGGIVDKTTVEDYGMGIERYNIILDSITSNSIPVDWNLLDSLRYTNSYNPSQSPYWFTEFTGNFETYGDLKVTSQDSAFSQIVADCQEKFQNRDRNIPDTWHTQHSVIYNLSSKTLQIKVQEKDTVYTVSLN